MSDTPTDNWTGAPIPEGPLPAPPRPRSPLRRRAAGIATVAGLSLGGLVGGYAISHAATTVATTPSPSASGSQAPGDGRHGGCDHGGIPGGPGHGLQSEDLSLVAGVIGISSSDLQSALQKGQTIAAVAKAHNVDVNKVISAWVASENKEIDDRASSGQISSAQATQMKSMTQQRITDMVNGTRPAGGPGPGHGFGDGGIA